MWYEETQQTPLVLIWFVHLHVHLVVGAESRSTAFQYDKVLLLQHRSLTQIALLGGPHKLFKAFSAQNMATSLDGNHLLIGELFHASGAGEST